MDAKGKEKGILKLEPRPRVVNDGKSALTPQGSCDRAPSSPHPSVDRLSVTWADPGSMTSCGGNLFHLPPETPVSSEVKFSPSAGDCSEDEDYSSLSAVLRQRRASIRRSRKERRRRPSSPFLQDDIRPRRRSSVFTTSSGDTAISIDEQPAVVTQEQIFENIHLHKEVLGSVKQQPLPMRRKLKIVHQAKTYIKRHEGQLQERLAQSKSTRDIYARFNILLATKWQQLKREAANTSNLLIPWELRIKEIESHFGSVVASYFTFLRWLFWVNLVIGFILLVFVIIPEYLTANRLQAGERKIILDEERRNATNLLTLWEFEGVLKCSPIFYGYYSNIENSEYRMPLAYFLTGLVVYIYSFVAILRKMAENSRMSKLSEKEDECIFSWKLFTGWDFMIGNAETAHNRIASVILGFKEALLEEAEKKKNLRNWRIISLRAIVNICVVILLAISAYAVVTVVSRSDDNTKIRNWWRENETTVVVTVISITFPLFFELLGFLENFHPRKQLRLQLARIMLLNLLNLYSLIFALFSKIEGMSKELYSLQPNLSMNAVVISNTTLNGSENLSTSIPLTCFETAVPCLPCNMVTFSPINEQIYTSTKQSMILPLPETDEIINKSTSGKINQTYARNLKTSQNWNVSNTLITGNLVKRDLNVQKDDVTLQLDNSSIFLIKEMERLRNLSEVGNFTEANDTIDSDVDPFYDINYDGISSTDNYENSDTSLLSNVYTYKHYDSDTTKKLSTISMDTAGYTDSESTFNSFRPIDSTDLNSKITKKSYSTIYSDYSTQTEPADTTYSTSRIIDNSVTKFTMFDATNTNFANTESTIESANTENSKSSTVYINSVPTDIITSTEDSKSETNYGYKRSSSTLNDITPTYSISDIQLCPNVTFNSSINCGKRNITHSFYTVNCTIVDVKCYVTKCTYTKLNTSQSNVTMIDTVYIDNHNRKMYNLTIETKKKLLKLCWETMFGQELVKLTMMDLVFVLLGTLFMDFFRALFVRYMNRCWCWDLEKKFPEYGDFKIAENILHLINNQGMVWMGMFFSPGLVVLNVFKLMIMMYLRSWAVITCNVPHEVVFRVSKSNNFYLALLLTMLFLCVLPVGYTIVWVKPSWHCGPFSEYDKIYYILTTNIYKIFPKSLNFALEYITSPAIVIPLLVLLILIIYYLTSLTNSLREANNDLKIQLRRERTEERRKMFQLADTRRRVGSSAMDNTPFARWKKALPSFPINKSIDSDERRNTTAEDTKEPIKTIKKRGGIFEKIVGLAIDRKTNSETSCDPSPSLNNIEDETDTDFHESLPKELLKMKDISVNKNGDQRKKSKSPGQVEFNATEKYINKLKEIDVKLKLNNTEDSFERNNQLQQAKIAKNKEMSTEKCKDIKEDSRDENDKSKSKLNKKQNSESSNQSKQTDSLGSVIPVITISTTESDDETLQTTNQNKEVDQIKKMKKKCEDSNKNDIVSNSQTKKMDKSSSDSKSLQRQSSVDSINENKSKKEKN